jgi:hypothetical protein
LTNHFGEVLQREMRQTSPEELLTMLQDWEPLATSATEAAAQPELTALPASERPQIHR